MSDDECIDEYNDIYSKLCQEAKDFLIIEEIERIEKPTALEFYREYVSQNKPVIITGLLKDWKAYKEWSDDYLEKVMKDVEVTVSITNDGLADAVKPINQNDQNSEKVFCKPFEKKIKFQEYIQHSKKPDNDEKLAYYIQYQNNSLNVEYEKLLNDIDESVIDFAKEAFGSNIDATNFWMGQDKSISSLHQDPYENMYCVVRGTKIFTLLPPIDYPFLYKSEFPSASFVNVGNDDNIKLEIQIDKDPEINIPWIPVDPTEPLEKNIKLGYPLIGRAHPITVRVEAGEILYLPSLYFHRVAQKSNKAIDGNSLSTIAINYWFDMKYGINYVYFQFLKETTKYQKQIKNKK
ncbi:hypothetical protein RB653_003788 [Dictyostelium firmibasis]|uniref:JmjC domain-containing protein n=1 Tax=Dictyostelium firmibasis TaxID=79012 RepID=A0AAN7U555_9MYCE